MVISYNKEPGIYQSNPAQAILRKKYLLPHIQWPYASPLPIVPGTLCQTSSLLHSRVYTLVEIDTQCQIVVSSVKEIK